MVHTPVRRLARLPVEGEVRAATAPGAGVLGAPPMGVSLAVATAAATPALRTVAAATTPAAVGVVGGTAAAVAAAAV